MPLFACVILVTVVIVSRGPHPLFHFRSGTRHLAPKHGFGRVPDADCACYESSSFVIDCFRRICRLLNSITAPFLFLVSEFDPNPAFATCSCLVLLALCHVKKTPSLHSPAPFFGHPSFCRAC